MLVPQDALRQLGEGHGDAIVGRALQLDNLIGSISNIGEDLIQLFRLWSLLGIRLAELRHAQAADVGMAPHREL
ncbi:hypothetical protein D3C73_1384090 [compost metagenome]